MTPAPRPANETARIEALQDLDVLDTGPEAEFDALVHAASLVCGVPISLISLVDTERQWFKANLGLPGATETPRDVAFCAHAILGEEIFEVPDAQQDPRFADNPLVTSAPDIRFYAGAPVQLSSGQRVGTLCVIDRQPRKLDESQREILRRLAQAAAAALEGRRAMRTQQRVLRDLSASQARFQTLSESSPHGVFYTDAQGRCTYTNGRWQEIYGMTFEQSLGDGWTKTLHPEDRAGVLAAWQKAAAEQRDYCGEFRILRANDSEHIVHARARSIVDERGEIEGYVGSVEDVTELRSALAWLTLSEERLRHLYESTPAMLHSIDSTGRLVTVSNAWLSKLGYTRAEVLGRPSADFLTADSREYATQNVLPDFFATGRCENVAYQMVKKNGDVIDVLLSAILERGAEGQPQHSLAVIEDVTMRRRAERALEAEHRELEEAHKRMALATDSGGIGIWDLDLVNNHLVWDEWMYRLYGMVPQSDIGTYDLWKRHVHPDDVGLAEQIVADSLANSNTMESEFRVVWSDGSVHHMCASARITRDADGHAVRMVGANWDVSVARQLATELAEQHELLRVTLRSIGDAVITTNAHGDVVWLNPVAERMTGWSSEEARGKPLPHVFHIVNEETRQPGKNPVELCLAEGKIVGLANHTVLVSRDGTEYGIEDSAAPIRNDRGDMLGSVLVFHDVTEQRRLSGEMTYRATHDALTGLVNRTEFESRLRRVLNKAHEERSEHALMYIDLDQFKLVNDACGHSVGDQLLQQVAKLLAEGVRARDTLARLGGDEFAVILEHCTVDQAQRVAQLLCDRMEDFRFTHDGRRFRIGTSIGLVAIDNRWGTLAAILQAADSACYAAKEAGRNRVHAWYDTDQIMRDRQGESHWATRIEQAIDDNLFTLYAQRIVALGETSDGIHAEVLLRMVDTNGDIIPPSAFLPAAERFHLATRVDRWVLKHVVDWMKSAQTLEALGSLNVNLSGQSIGDRAFHRWVFETLADAGRLICSKLCFEITETAAVTCLADAAAFFEEVRAAGVKVALDDFGAGASSFGYLKSLPVDYIKIDGQFIRDMIDDPLDEAAVRCFVDVAQVVGVKTVAEFVDKTTLLDRARLIGIDYAQGFLLHRPEPLHQLEGLGQSKLESTS